MFLFAACVSSLEKCLFKTLSHLKIKYFFVPSYWSSYWAAYIFSFVFYLFFYWRIIALQNFVVFCQTSTWISHTTTAKSLQSCLTLCDPIPGKDSGAGCHFLHQCIKVKSESEVAQPCPTLHNPMVCSLPGSSVHGIFQARVLEWSAIAFSVNQPWVYIYPLAFEPPYHPPPQPTPLGWYRARLSFLNYAAYSRWLSILHMVM